MRSSNLILPRLLSQFVTQKSSTLSVPLTQQKRFVRNSESNYWRRKWFDLDLAVLNEWLFTGDLANFFSHFCADLHTCISTDQVFTETNIGPKLVLVAGKQNGVERESDYLLNCRMSTLHEGRPEFFTPIHNFFDMNLSFVSVQIFELVYV